MHQDKSKEIEFFDKHSSAEEYNVFSDSSNERIVTTCLAQAGLTPPGVIADLGCGSGIFTSLLTRAGFDATGVDISSGMIRLASTLYPATAFVQGDVEDLRFENESLDGVLLSGLLHHLPDPTACIREVWRVLKPGGSFAAFDPNRRNPFMYLYRDRSSPFYSSKGVTPNERPVLAERLADQFRSEGFSVRTNYLSNLHYRYVASPVMRHLLPMYNLVDSIASSLPFGRRLRAFVITSGRKPAAS